VTSADVQKLTLKRPSETLTFKKDDKGEWMIVEPLEAKADSLEVGGLVDAFADLKIDRVVEKAGGDPKKYDIPQREVSLWVKGQDRPVHILLGPPNKIDATVYAQKEGDPRIVLLPSTLTTPLERSSSISARRTSSNSRPRTWPGSRSRPKARIGRPPKKTTNGCWRRRSRAWPRKAR